MLFWLYNDIVTDSRADSYVSHPQYYLSHDLHIIFVKMCFFLMTGTSPVSHDNKNILQYNVINCFICHIWC